MTDDMKFRCIALDQVVDPEAIRRDMVRSYFGGMLPGEPVKLDDAGIDGETAG